MTVDLEQVDTEIKKLDEQLTAERKAESDFRSGVNARIENLDAKIDELVKRVPARATSAFNDLAVRVARVFTFTFIATFIPLVSGLGAFPDLVTAKAAAWSAAVAALAAVLKLVQASLTASEAPFLGKGVGKPPAD